MDFRAFPKIARLRRDIVITEKIDGTNGLICIQPQGATRPVPAGVHYNGFIMGVGSRSRWITATDDNFGFAAWAYDHAEQLIDGLGEGYHYGEWWGNGIQRRYGLGHKRFSLFNVGRWCSLHEPFVPSGLLSGKETTAPACCHVVPTLYRGPINDTVIEHCLERLRVDGSYASPGFMRPEGVIIFHTAGGHLYKVTLEKDHEPKSVSS